jgi:hypothetical protein
MNVESAFALTPAAFALAIVRHLPGVVGSKLETVRGEATSRALPLLRRAVARFGSPDLRSD